MEYSLDFVWDEGYKMFVIGASEFGPRGFREKEHDGGMLAP